MINKLVRPYYHVHVRRGTIAAFGKILAIICMRSVVCCAVEAEGRRENDAQPRQKSGIIRMGAIRHIMDRVRYFCM